MRRKIVRKSKENATSNVSVVKAVKLVCFTLLVSVMAALIVLLSFEAVDDFNEYKAMWDAQNECIAHLVSQGVERSNIDRVGISCEIGE